MKGKKNNEEKTTYETHDTDTKKKYADGFTDDPSN